MGQDLREALDVYPVRKVAIIGSGLMGCGIAEACARAGVPTVLIKATPGSVEGAKKRVLGSLDGAVKKGKLEQSARDAAALRLTFADDLAALADCELVIETALETVPAKQALFARIEKLAKPDAILASNTSALPLRELTAGLARPERFLGMHFFSPAQVMKLCEVAPTPATDDKVRRTALGFVETLGKTPVIVRDEPGYIVNRLLVPYLLQAMEAVEGGLASTESVDTAMKLGCGHPLGPLALADLIGLDVVLSMAKSMYEEQRDARYRPPSILRRLVLANQLGKKSGAGFFVYDGGAAPVANPNVTQHAAPADRRKAAAS